MCNQSQQYHGIQRKFTAYFFQYKENNTEFFHFLPVFPDFVITSNKMESAFISKFELYLL